METVFEANLAIDAHLVRDLLERAGIPAVIEGEHLQGAAGELPLGGLVRVRVQTDHAAEAREVVAEWEKRQPEPESGVAAAAAKAAPERRTSWAPYTFLMGLAIGGFLVWQHFNTPIKSDGVDFGGDGVFEERYVYEGMKTTLMEYDRNSDGHVDYRYEFDSHGVAVAAKGDDDFDQRFEISMRLAKGQPAVIEYDRDGDEVIEQVYRFTNGVVTSIEYVSPDTRRVVKRDNFRGGQAVSADYDADGDGQFESHVEYDYKSDPRL
jgi:hypothetical protein